MHQGDIADEIFKIWDRKLRRHIKLADFSKNLISLGLAPNQNTVQKILIALKGDDSNFPDQINLKEFRQIFENSRFGTKATEKIELEFKEANADFAHKQFVRIIGSELLASLETSSPKKSKKVQDDDSE